MANKIPDFSKLWAVNGQKYQFTDEQYLSGWSFIGSIPPARQQFDSLQYVTDVKLLWLFDKCEKELTVIVSSTEPTTQRDGGIWLDTSTTNQSPHAAKMVVSYAAPETAAVWGDLSNITKVGDAVEGDDLAVEIEVQSKEPTDKAKLWGLLNP